MRSKNLILGVQKDSALTEVLQRRLVLRHCPLMPYVPLPDVGSANGPLLEQNLFEPKAGYLDRTLIDNSAPPCFLLQ